MLLAVSAFALAAALIVVLPGPDTLVVIRGIVRGGRARAVATAAGILVGLAVWVVAAALGLAAVLRASEVGYAALRIAGAIYLVLLGVHALRTRRADRAVAPDSTPAPEQPAVPSRSAGRSAGRGGVLGTGFVAGLLTDLLNPKVGVFFLTFLPGFIPHGDAVGPTSLLFGLIYIAETALYCAILVALAAKVTGWMTTPRVRRRLDTLTAAVLIGFGVRLAVES